MTLEVGDLELAALNSFIRLILPKTKHDPMNQIYEAFAWLESWQASYRMVLLTSRILLRRQDFFACGIVAGTLRVPSPALPVTFNFNAGYGTRSVPTTLAARPR